MDKSSKSTKSVDFCFFSFTTGSFSSTLEVTTAGSGGSGMTSCGKGGIVEIGVVFGFK